MSATPVDVEWTVLAAPDLPRNPGPAARAGPTALGEYVAAQTSAGRALPELDTSVGLGAAAHCSSESLTSDSTMESDHAHSSETDEEPMPDSAVSAAEAEAAVKEEPGSPMDAVDAELRPHSPSSPRAAGPAPPAPVRNRIGRPRRLTTSRASRPAHTRTKTGCITCRKRKKKCDERKPDCNNCENNNLRCEGYPPRRDFVPGRLGPAPLSIARMPEAPSSIFRGLETELDHFLFTHFSQTMSTILTLDANQSNPFVELVIPMSADHKGLMHSLLALSGAHWSRFTPGDRGSVERRKAEHLDSAFTALREEVDEARAAQGRGEDPAEPLVASIILQCLIPITEGSVEGSHSAHLAAARACIRNPQGGSAFAAFAWEFYKYHDMSNTMTSLDRPPLAVEELLDDDDLPPATPVDGGGAPHGLGAGPAGPAGPEGAAGPGVAGQPPRVHMPAPPTPAPGAEGVMMGVCDGLFRYITRITGLRDRIRARKQARQQPVVEYRSIRAASALGARLLAWQSGHPVHTPKWVCAELYRETALVYLHRSLRASRPDEDLRGRVDRGLTYLRALPARDAAQSIVLLPTFVLGCAAFHPDQREHVRNAFAQSQAYSGLGNIPRAQEVVRQVWRLMDADDERSWDWETIMANMGYRFLVT